MERRFGEARQSHVRNGGAASAQHDIRRRTGHDNVETRRPRGVPQADVSDTDALGRPVELGKTDFLPRHVQSSLVKRAKQMQRGFERSDTCVSSFGVRVVAVRARRIQKNDINVFYVRLFCDK